MRARFLIVSNDLKHLSDHSAEMVLAVATAARAGGFLPVLAAHVDCSVQDVPEWLDVYPLFCSDHATSSLPPPYLFGLRGDLVALHRTPISAVLDGTASLGEYLLARFEEPPYRSGLSERWGSGDWKGKLKKIVQDFVPPLIAPRGKYLWRNRGRLTAVGMATLAAILPPLLYRTVRWVFQRRILVPSFRDAVVAPPSSGVEEQNSFERTLAESGLESDFEPVQAFRRDLERLLCMMGVLPTDHVFLPNAHGREWIAVHHLVEALPPGAAPTFHLQFRRDPAVRPSDPGVAPDPVTQAHGLCFKYLRRFLPNPSIRLYTDSAERSAAYQICSGFAFDTLPLPLRTALVDRRIRAEALIRRLVLPGAAPAGLQPSRAA